MRFEGRIARWNDERGFGFIEPAAGGDQVFVHIRAFAPVDRGADARPRMGERISFEIGSDDQGRKQARRVSRLDAIPVRVSERLPGVPERRGDAGGDRRGYSAPAGGSGRWLGLLVGWVVVGLIGWQAYQWWAAQGQRTAKPMVAAPSGVSGGSSSAHAVTFRCDGRRYCSQMTSCEEATYFLRNCPGVQMDGNGDGVPCEQQWCTRPLAP
ncbi:excalibur calcium-binding domain-containing protein [Acidovorax sp. MR-S7]|uniref:excalibur calcium-binding domain-containing protein n=1 Tax=Acidovorax sp. MR-S7 TaxID=1268622 RepID=UPI00037836B0|nr:excalibur calcium-binding domain-containing protein [Acidovorax sp. MR-S7]GAD24129.1 cold shock proteins [Acidovorax sp. MR-S7]